MTTGELHSEREALHRPDRDRLLSLTPRRWAPAVFGVVPIGAKRRRPGDILRVVVAAFVVAITAPAAHSLALREKRLFDLLADLPSWTRSGAEVGYRLATVGVVIALIAALLVSKRFGLATIVVVAGGFGTVASYALRELVDTEKVRTAAHMTVSGRVPEYPVVWLATAVTIVLVAGPYLLRPIRRVLFLDLAFASLAAVIAVVGLPIDVIGTFALAWGVAAVVHLAIGTPAATPLVEHVAQALEGLGVAVDDLQLAPSQVWGETRYTARAPDGAPVAIDVIGRDAADARLLAKVWHALWYKDSGPTIALTRTQQLEHRAYLLMLAGRAGVPVSEVVIAGVGGSRELAVLVLREPDGRPLGERPHAEITDTTLDSAWGNLAALTAARIAHGSLRADNVVVRPDGTTAFVDFAYASAVAPPERCSLDAVRCSSRRPSWSAASEHSPPRNAALGRDGLTDILPTVEPAALTECDAPRDSKTRRSWRRRCGKRARRAPGTELAKPVELRRVSWTDVAMAAGAILGVYLIVGEFAGIDWATTFSNAEWGWVAVAFIISFGPSFSGSISLMGAVAAPLPFKPVLAEQFANNFTGLIGGTVANTALVIRFFQRQGLKVAVAASSGIMNSLAGGMVQVALVALGLIFTASDFQAPSDSGLIRLVALLFLVAALLLIALLVVPKLRRRARAVVQPQWKAAPRQPARHPVDAAQGRDALRGQPRRPRCCSRWCSRPRCTRTGRRSRCSSSSSSTRSPPSSAAWRRCPGGMGVIEAGLIGGMTAAGVPQEIAVATTFTARACTAYLPPIWGWFALQWLRKNEYV